MAIWLDADRIVRVKVLPNAVMTLADAIEGNAVTEELCGGEPRPRLCDYTEIRSQEADCRTYYAGPETARCCLACAILVGSPVSRVIGNFYLGLTRPITPTRLFDDEAKALEWLRGFEHG